MYMKMVSYYHNLGYEINSTLMHTVSIGIFEIRRENFISILIEKAGAIRDELLRRINDDCQTLCNKYVNKYHFMMMVF